MHTLAGAQDILSVGATRVYTTCGASAFSVCAYRTGTGTLAWTREEIPSAPAAEAGGVLYLSNGVALNAATGAMLTSLWPGAATALAVGNGRVAVETDPRVLDLYGLRGS